MKAKTLTAAEFDRALAVTKPMQRAMLLCSHRAGLRAMEIANLRWEMLIDASGQIADSIDLPNRATKKRSGGAKLPMAPDLREALTLWRGRRRCPLHGPVFCDGKGQPLTAHAVALRLKRIYRKAGLKGCTSHSGRRTFATRLAQNVTLADLQKLMRHAQPSTTLLYVDPSEDASLVAAVHALAE